MQQTELNEKMLEEARKQMLERRKKIIRYNTLLSLFFCVVIIGLAGAIWYYNKIDKLYKEKNDLNTQLIKAAYKDSLSSDSIQKQNIKLGEYAKLLEVCAAKTKVPGLDSTQAAYLKTDVVAIKKRDTARAYSEIGYAKLKAYDFAGALTAFDKSEKSFNGYRESYEIYYLLWQNRKNFNNPDVQKQMLTKILNEYNSKKILKASDIK